MKVKLLPKDYSVIRLWHSRRDRAPVKTFRSRGAATPSGLPRKPDHSSSTALATFS